MNKTSLPATVSKYKRTVGTRVVFYPVSGADYTAEGTIIKRFEAGRSGAVSYLVRVLSGIGAGKDWNCGPDDITAAEPTPGAWGPGRS